MKVTLEEMLDAAVDSFQRLTAEEQAEVRRKVYGQMTGKPYSEKYQWMN